MTTNAFGIEVGPVSKLNDASSVRARNHRRSIAGGAALGTGLGAQAGFGADAVVHAHLADKNFKHAREERRAFQDANSQGFAHIASHYKKAASQSGEAGIKAMTRSRGSLKRSAAAGLLTAGGAIPLALAISHKNQKDWTAANRKPSTVIKAFRPEPVEKGLGEAFKVGADAVKGGLGALKIGASSQGAKLVAKKPVQAGISSFKATKLGVTKGPMTANRAGAHLGIAAGHATTLGGAAVGTTGVLAGAGLMHAHDKSALGKSWQEIAKSEWKTIHQREQAQRRNRKAAEWTNTAALTGGALGLYHGATRAQHARGRADARSAFGARRELDNISGGRVASSTVKAERDSRQVKATGATAGDVARGASAYLRGKGKGSLKTAVVLGVGGTAGSAALYGRNSYHQHKINDRRRKRLGRVTDSQD